MFFFRTLPNGSNTSIFLIEHTASPGQHQGMETDHIEIEVSGYELIGTDSSSSENHIFEIKVWLSQNFYFIKRSYSNFCEFDFQLNKKYSKSNLPTCPLSSSISSSSSKTLLKQTTTTHRKNSIIKSIGNNEIVSTKKNLLQKYLEELLDIPEILRSLEFLTFLDIESPNGFDIPQEKMELIEYLLGNNGKETHVTVMKEFNLRLGVNESQYVIWRFTTKNKDIGFDVLMETGVLSLQTNTVATTSLLPYQRYKSHETVVEDVLEIQSSGFILLHWDNTYSKMLSKQLSYTFRVVDAEVYQEATQVCLDFTRNKLECESKRNLLRRILTTKSNSILASAGIRASMSASSILDYKSSVRSHSVPSLPPSLPPLSHFFSICGVCCSGCGGSSQMLYDEMQNEIEQLKNEKTQLQMSLSAAELTISSMKDKEEEYQKEVSEPLGAVSL
jgi:hypothetical protein